MCKGKGSGEENLEIEEGRGSLRRACQETGDGKANEALMSDN